MRKYLFLMSLLTTFSGWALKPENIRTLTDLQSINWEPKAVIHPQGNVSICWFKKEGDQVAIWEAGRVDSIWYASQPLTTAGNIRSFTPFFDKSGKAAIIFEDERSNQLHHTFIKREKTGWGMKIPLEVSKKSWKEGWKIEQVSFDAEGNPFLLAAEKNSPYGPLYYAKFPDLEIKETHKITGTDECLFSKVVKDKEGKPAVLWISSRITMEGVVGFRTELYDYHFQISSYENWSANGSCIDTGKIKFDHLIKNKENEHKEKAEDIAASRNKRGNTALIWNHHTLVNYQLRAVVNSELETIRVVSKDSISEYKIFIDDQNPPNTVAIWIEKDDDKNVVFATVKPQNKVWHAPKRLSNREKYASHIQISQSSNHFIVVWAETDDPNESYESAVYGSTLLPPKDNEQMQWSKAELLSPEGVFCLHPTIAFKEDGKGVIAWSTHIPKREYFKIQVADLSVK